MSELLGTACLRSAKKVPSRGAGTRMLPLLLALPSLCGADSLMPIGVCKQSNDLSHAFNQEFDSNAREWEQLASSLKSNHKIARDFCEVGNNDVLGAGSQAHASLAANTSHVPSLPSTKSLSFLSPDSTHTDVCDFVQPEWARCLTGWVPSWVDIVNNNRMGYHPPQRAVEAAHFFELDPDIHHAIHANAAYLISNVTPDPEEDPGHVILACDGSFPDLHVPAGKEPWQPAWAVVVGSQKPVGADPEFHVNGILSDRCSRAGVSTANDNVGAEAIAVFFALLYLASHREILTAELLVDCYPIIHLLNRSSGVVHLGDAGDLILHLFDFVSTRCYVKVTHIHGHCGQPWNELADSLAKAASRGLYSFPPDDLWLTVGHEQGGEWAWIYNQQSFPAYPTHDGSAFVFQGVVDKTAPDDIAPLTVVKAKPALFKNLRVISYKAGSLCDTVRVEKRPQYIDRAPLLAEQFKDFHLIGIQEARTDPGSKALGDFLRVSGGKSKNRKGSSILGIEVWVNTKLNLLESDTAEAFISPNDVTIVSTNHPRIMLISIRNRYLDIYVLAAIRKFWDELQAVIGNRTNVILLIDGNARLGSITSTAVGDFDPDDESLNGSLLHKFATDSCLCIPSTFFHDGPSTTWRAPNGSEHRGDYVAVPTAWFPCVQRSFPVFDFDNLAGVDDHVPIALQIAARFESKDTHKRDAWPRPSPAALRNRAHLDYFVLLLQQYNSPDFSVSVDDHYKFVVDYFHWAASLAFPDSRAKCRRQYFSDHTWNIVLARKHITKTFKKFIYQRSSAVTASLDTLKKIIHYGYTTVDLIVAHQLGPAAEELRHIANMLQIPLQDADAFVDFDPYAVNKSIRTVLLKTIATSARQDKKRISGHQGS